MRIASTAHLRPARSDRSGQLADDIGRRRGARSPSDRWPAMWHDRSHGPPSPAEPREPDRPPRRVACPSRRGQPRPALLPDPARGHRRLRARRRDPHHALREAVDARVGLRLVQLGDRDGPRPGRLGLRHVAGRAGGRLVAHPVRCRHARHDHRRPRRDGHRLPAQGGPGIGSVGVQGPHRRLWLEQYGPRPHRRAPRRRLPAEGGAARRRREEPRRQRRLLRPRRHDERGRPRARGHRGSRRRDRVPGRFLRRGRHALDPHHHGDQVGRARRSGPSPRSTIRATSRISGGPRSTSSSSRPRSPRTSWRARHCTRGSRRS